MCSQSWDVLPNALQMTFQPSLFASRGLFQMGSHALQMTCQPSLFAPGGDVPEGRAHAFVVLLAQYPSGHPEEGEGCEKSPKRRQSHRNREIHRDSETCQLVHLAPLWVGRAEHPRLQGRPGPRGAGSSAGRELARRSSGAMGSMERFVAARPWRFVERLAGRLVGPQWPFVERVEDSQVLDYVIRRLASFGD